MYVYIHIYIYIYTHSGRPMRDSSGWTTCDNSARPKGRLVELGEYLTCILQTCVRRCARARGRSSTPAELQLHQIYRTHQHAVLMGNFNTHLSALLEQPLWWCSATLRWEAGGIRLKTSSGFCWLKQTYHRPQFISIHVKHRGFSSNSSLQTTLFQEHSANLSSMTVQISTQLRPFYYTVKEAILLHS